MPSTPTNRRGEPTEPPPRPRERVRRQVSRLLRRARLVSFGGTFIRVSFYAACAAATASLLTRGEGVVPLAGTAVLAALLLSLGLEAFRSRDAIALAKRLDDEGGLADRFSTAVEFSGRTTGVAEAVMEDAADRAAGVRPSQVLPFRSPRETFLLPLPILCLALVPGVIFPKPPGPSPGFLRAVEAEREALEEFLAAERAGPLSPEREAALDRLRRLADEMRKKRTSKRSILTATGRVIAQMRSAKKKLVQKRAAGIESLLERMKKVPLLRPIAEEIEAVRFAQAAILIEEVLRKIEAKTVLEGDLGDVRKDELEGLLRKLRNVGKDLRFVNKVLQFLEEIEGEIGDLSELVDPEDLEFWQERKRPPRRREEEKPPGAQRPGQRQGSPDWGRGTTETPFGDPRRNKPDETKEGGVRAKEGRGKSSVSTFKTPQEQGRSALSYREKYAKFKQMAEDVLYREEIPVGYREYIKRYFDRIQPEEEE